MQKFCCKIINNFSIIIHFSCPALYLLSSGRSPAPVPSGPAAPLPPDLLPQNRPPADRNRCSVVKKHFSLFNVQKSAVLFLQGPALLLFILSNSSSVWQAALLFFSPILLARKPTRTRSPSTRTGRLTSIPSVASRVSCSSSVISFKRSFSPRDLYSCPEVLKNFFSGSPLAFHQCSALPGWGGPP